MNFIINLSFKSKGLDGEPRHSMLSMILSEKNTERALDRLRGSLIQLRKDDDIFEDAEGEIFIDEIIRIKKFPTDPMCMKILSGTMEDGEWYGVSRCGPHMDGDADPYMESFLYGDEEGEAVEPFITFLPDGKWK